MRTFYRQGAASGRAVVADGAVPPPPKLKGLEATAVYARGVIADDSIPNPDPDFVPRHLASEEHEALRFGEHIAHPKSNSNEIGKDTKSQNKWKYIVRPWLEYEVRHNPRLHDLIVTLDHAIAAKLKGIRLAEAVAFTHEGQRALKALPAGADHHIFAVVSQLARTAGMKVKRKSADMHCQVCGIENTRRVCQACVDTARYWEVLQDVSGLLDRAIPTDGVRLTIPGRKRGRPVKPKPRHWHRADLTIFAKAFADIARRLFAQTCPGMSIETNQSLDEMAIAADDGDVASIARVAHLACVKILTRNKEKSA